MIINLTLNGSQQSAEVSAHETLLDFVRRQGLTGTKRVCESGECGACAVIVNGRAVDSCILLAAQINGSTVTTIEGLGDLTELNEVQEAFAENGAVQCGFCIPGMIVAATAYLEENKQPTDDEVRHVFVGNLCRCTGYLKPVEAVLAAAQRMKEGTHGD